MKMLLKNKIDDEQIWNFMKQYLCIPENVVQNALQDFAQSKEKSLEKNAETFFKGFLKDLGIHIETLSEREAEFVKIFELMLVSRALIDEIMAPNKPAPLREDIIEAQGEWTARECLQLLGRASHDSTTRTWQNWRSLSNSNEKRRLNPELFTLFRFKKNQKKFTQKIGELNG